jgi:hypothetical protein
MMWQHRTHLTPFALLFRLHHLPRQCLAQLAHQHAGRLELVLCASLGLPLSALPRPVGVRAAGSLRHLRLRRRTAAPRHLFTHGADLD